MQFCKYKLAEVVICGHGFLTFRELDQYTWMVVWVDVKNKKKENLGLFAEDGLWCACWRLS